MIEVTAFDVARRMAQSLTHADARAPRHVKEGLCPNRPCWPGPVCATRLDLVLTSIVPRLDLVKLAG